MHYGSNIYQQPSKDFISNKLIKNQIKSFEKRNHWWVENKPSDIIYAEILSTQYGDCSVFHLFIEIGTTSVITYSISCTSES